jgi:signal transduction histidine kinase
MRARFVPILVASTKDLGDHVEARLRDNGTGIPSNVLDKIFAPFFTTKPAGQGPGLGLSISHDILRGHGGSLSVESVEGEYTEFAITLPKRQSTPTRSTDPSHQPDRPDVPHLGRDRLLTP